MGSLWPGIWFTTLLGGMLLVNGATDTPVVIAGAVGAGILSPRRGVMLSAAANLLGLWMAVHWMPGVGRTVASLACFPDESTALRGLCSGMAAAVCFSLLSWWRGLPSSEGHALMAGVSGAAWACGVPVDGLVWKRTALGVLLSVIPALILSRLCSRLLATQRQRGAWGRRLSRSLIGTTILEAWLHGAQDGQKFYALYLLSHPGRSVASGNGLWWIGGLLAAGCLLGGGRILRTVSVELGRPDPADGISGALGCGGALLLCTLLGLPASTTHAKSCGLIGAQASVSHAEGRKTVFRLTVAFVLTVPVCFALGALFAALL